MRKQFAAVVLLTFAPCLAFGQTQKDHGPSPEIQKLGYYVGTWKGRGETKGGPFGPAGKLSSEQTCNWFAGRFHIVCRGEETGPTGKREFLNIIGYDQKTRAYTQHSISSFGETEDDRGGSLIADKLVFVIDGNAGSKRIKFRYTEVHVSPVLYTYRAEASLGGGPWTVVGEGKISKVK